MTVLDVHDDDDLVLVSERAVNVQCCVRGA
jgi:hypothetical protein